MFRVPEGAMETTTSIAARARRCHAGHATRVYKHLVMSPSYTSALVLVGVNATGRDHFGVHHPAAEDFKPLTGIADGLGADVDFG